jgi:hypothetical protein
MDGLGWDYMVKAKRKTGEKKSSGNGLFKLPPFTGLRTPDPKSPLGEFVASLGGEISLEEAVVEFQSEWCDHPHRQQTLISTIAFPHAERFEYEYGCKECGVVKQRKGRPPKWLRRN